MRGWILSVWTAFFLLATGAPAETAIQSRPLNQASGAAVPDGGRPEGWIEKEGRRILGSGMANEAKVLRLREIELPGHETNATGRNLPGPADRVILGHLNYLADGRVQPNGFLWSIQRFGMSLLLLIIAVGVVYLVFKTVAEDNQKMNMRMEIVRLRYALGEITADDYSIIKKELEWWKRKRHGHVRTVFLELEPTRSEHSFPNFSDETGSGFIRTRDGHEAGVSEYRNGEGRDLFGKKDDLILCRCSPTF